ncbi:hypothetical protein QL285_082491 [Trifolium repens]|nr:hypothetical protein QL285_082491 [Trifolium repens]
MTDGGENSGGKKNNAVNFDYDTNEKKSSDKIPFFNGNATSYPFWKTKMYSHDDRNFYGILGSIFSSKMTKTVSNMKKNLQNPRKASRSSPRCKKTRKSPKSEENVLIIVARWFPSCHDGSHLLAKKSTEKILRKSAHRSTMHHIAAR